MVGLVDAMAHLDDPRVTDAAALLCAAAAVGVTDVICAGVDPLRSTTLPAAPPVRLWQAAGLHPAWVAPQRMASQLQALARLLPTLVAVGEIGLDGRPHMPPAALQEEAFVAQLTLARRANLPVILHCVHRLGRLLQLLEATPCRGMLHGFSGPKELLPRLQALGLYVSFGGLVGRPQARRCRAAAQAVADTALLLESDTPDHPLPGWRPSTPAMLPALAAAMGDLRGVSAASIQQLSANNARRLYKLPTHVNNGSHHD